MVLEECPTTKLINRYWKEQILDNFPVLESVIESKYLSLKEYITERPQKFFHKQVFNDYYLFLTYLKNHNPNLLVGLFKESEHEFNIAIKSLNEINDLDIHDVFEPNNNIELIRFIENNIHFNYLKLVEAVYHKFIYFIAYFSRFKRNKSVEGLDIFNCVEEINKTEYLYILTCYDHVIRNGIAHGGITFKESDTVYKGKTGKPFEISTRKIIRMFDDLLDTCNGFSLGLKIFLILNRDFIENNKLSIPKQFLIQELKAQSNAPKWNVIDCLENIMIDGKKQLNIFTENSLLDIQEVNYYAFRTAVFSEYFANGFDRYFFSLKSKYSLPGWAAYDGNILKRERLNQSDDLNGYKGVLESDLLYFVPKFKIPNFIRKAINLWTIFKSVFSIKYHSSTNYIFKRKFELRETKPFRRGFSIIINDPSIYILPEHNDQIIEIIREEYKKIVNYAIKKSKTELDSIFSKILRTKYIRVTIFDKDLRKRHLRDSGLIDSLVCSITLNKSKKIKTIDLIGGRPEQYGKYRIIWNKNWKRIEHV